MKEAESARQKISIPVLKETERYLLVYKPPGISFHIQGKKEGVMQILRRMEEEKLISSGERIYPVHRLDEMTSGIMVFARGRKSAEELGNNFRHGRVEKYYVALSDRRPRQKQGSVVGDMVRSRNSTWKLLHEKKNPAITFFITRKVLSERPLTLFLLKPKTGRTHQIRVAMKSLGSPVLGDQLYARYEMAREEDRGYLHAGAVRFELGGELVEWIEKPREGAEFLRPAFTSVWNSLGYIFDHMPKGRSVRPS